MCGGKSCVWGRGHRCVWEGRGRAVVWEGLHVCEGLQGVEGRCVWEELWEGDACVGGGAGCVCRRGCVCVCGKSCMCVGGAAWVCGVAAVWGERLRGGGLCGRAACVWEGRVCVYVWEELCVCGKSYVWRDGVRGCGGGGARREGNAPVCVCVRLCVCEGLRVGGACVGGRPWRAMCGGGEGLSVWKGAAVCGRGRCVCGREGCVCVYGVEGLRGVGGCVCVCVWGLCGCEGRGGRGYVEGLCEVLRVCGGRDRVCVCVCVRGRAWCEWKGRVCVGGACAVSVCGRAACVRGRACGEGRVRVGAACVCVWGRVWGGAV